MQNKFMIVLLLGASLIGLNGCATVGAVQNNVDYKFLDSYGENRLVERNNDIYMEKLDGSEKRQITNTPDIREEGAFFRDPNTIVYYEEKGPAWKRRLNFFIAFTENNNINKKEISMEEYTQLWDSRKRQ